MKEGIHIGIGCPSFVIGLPEHNPKPRTARGKRRHQARDKGAVKHAERAWASTRSRFPSRYEKALRSGD